VSGRRLDVEPVEPLELVAVVALLSGRTRLANRRDP
jgi:hypothetical protein